MHQRAFRCRVRYVLLFLLVQPAAAQIPELYDEWRWVQFDRSSGLPSLQILNLFELPSGEPWVHTLNGIGWYDGFQWVNVPVDSVPQGDFGRGHMSPDIHGVLFVVPPTLFRVTRDGATRVAIRWQGSTLAVHRAVILPDSIIMLQGDTALYVYRDGAVTLDPSPFQSELLRIPDNPFGLMQTSDGVVWLNAPTGLYRWAGNRWRVWYGCLRGEYLTIHALEEHGEVTARCRRVSARVS